MQPSETFERGFIRWLLQNRDTEWLCWYEPDQGLKADGTPASCHRMIRMKVVDCILHARHRVKAAHPDKVTELSDEELLVEFMAVHWASPSPGEFPKPLLALSRRMRLQDNRMTSHPIFLVMDGPAAVGWAFTLEGAQEAWRELGLYHQKEPDIYVCSMHRCPELRELREWLLRLPDPHDAEFSSHPRRGAKVCTSEGLVGFVAGHSLDPEQGLVLTLDLRDRAYKRRIQVPVKDVKPYVEELPDEPSNSD